MASGEAPSPAALHVREEGAKLAHYLSSGKKKNDRWYWLTPSGAQGRTSVSWAKKNKGNGKTKTLLAVHAEPKIPTAKDLFEEMDADHSGSLDQEEVAALYKKARGEDLSKKDLKKAMKEMDSDNSGEVDVEEFGAWWATNGGDLEKQRNRAFTLVCKGGIELLLFAPTEQAKQVWVDGCSELLGSATPKAEVNGQENSLPETEPEPETGNPGHGFVPPSPATPRHESFSAANAVSGSPLPLQPKELPLKDQLARKLEEQNHIDERGFRATKRTADVVELEMLWERDDLVGTECWTVGEIAQSYRTGLVMLRARDLRGVGVFEGSQMGPWQERRMLRRPGTAADQGNPEYLGFQPGELVVIEEAPRDKDWFKGHLLDAPDRRGWFPWRDAVVPEARPEGSFFLQHPPPEAGRVDDALLEAVSGLGKADGVERVKNDLKVLWASFASFFPARHALSSGLQTIERQQQQLQAERDKTLKDIASKFDQEVAKIQSEVGEKMGVREADLLQSLNQNDDQRDGPLNAQLRQVRDQLAQHEQQILQAAERGWGRLGDQDLVSMVYTLVPFMKTSLQRVAEIIAGQQLQVASELVEEGVPNRGQGEPDEFVVKATGAILSASGAFDAGIKRTQCWTMAEAAEKYRTMLGQIDEVGDRIRAQAEQRGGDLDEIVARMRADLDAVKLDRRDGLDDVDPATAARIIADLKVLWLWVLPWPTGVADEVLEPQPEPELMDPEPEPEPMDGSGALQAVALGLQQARHHMEVCKRGIQTIEEELQALQARASVEGLIRDTIRERKERLLREIHDKTSRERQTSEDGLEKWYNQRKVPLDAQHKGISAERDEYYEAQEALVELISRTDSPARDGQFAGLTNMQLLRGLETIIPHLKDFAKPEKLREYGVYGANQQGVADEAPAAPVATPDDVRSKVERFLQEMQESVQAECRPRDNDMAEIMRKAARAAEAGRASAEQRHKALQTQVQREEERARQTDSLAQFRKETFANEETARRKLEEVGWDLARALDSYLPETTLASSNFKAAYDEEAGAEGQMGYGLAVAEIIQGYCKWSQLHGAGVGFNPEGRQFLKELQREALDNPEDDIEVMALRMWTSATTMQGAEGAEFCKMLNFAARRDDKDESLALASVVRGINKLCVTADGNAEGAVHPPDNVCYRGGGFPHVRYRAFFEKRRKFRQPAFFATSFSEAVARRFIEMRGGSDCVLWRVRIDPERKCVHVNLVKKTNFPGEEEYVFAPYSVFTVVSAEWKAGTTDDPHVIELQAAVDNKGEPEDLPLAPWS